MPKAINSTIALAIVMCAAALPSAAQRASTASEDVRPFKIHVDDSVLTDLLTNITLYWVTQTATSSARIYYENQRAPASPCRVEMPTACAVFPKEISIPPRRWAEAQYNVTR